ncbi:proton-conducting transporter membrane subunit [Wenzhouxiangella limi]|uniref:Oxidoreductase n=1 Tax=Wenzhouxiangella limi TaxID=2707351 RepID=A0A845VA30_9GAMM|nr:oxidoreductase [Wenzhouxiangella limi]
MSAAVHLLPLSVVLPITAGVLAPALFHRRHNACSWWAITAAALTLATTLTLVSEALDGGLVRYPVGGWPAPYGIELVFDGLGILMGSAAGLLTLLILIASRAFVQTEATPQRHSLFHGLVLINLGGMNGFLAASDLFNLFVFMEVFSISAYALVALARGPVAALAALKYLIVGAVSSMLVLLAIALLHAQTGSLNMSDIGDRLAAAQAPAAAGLALGCLVVGFLVKAAVFPLHFWLPDAHASAPSPVSALLSGLVVKMGIVGLIRTRMLFAEADIFSLVALDLLLVWLGVAAIVIGAVLAMIQRELKLMLAYSTVTNMGYIALGLGLATPAAVGGALAHMGFHALIKTGLFLSAGALVLSTGLSRIDDLRGLAQRMPVSSAALTLALLAVAGLPPTAGFVGKWQIALGALEAGQPWLIAVVMSGALLTLAWAIRIINSLYFLPPARGQVLTADEAPLSIRAPILMLGLVAMVGGLAGAMVLEWIEPLSFRILEAGHGH